MGELKPGWKRVKFGEVVRLCRETCKDPSAEGIDRVIGLEHLEPGDLRVRSWADLADGTTFTQRVRPGQVLFGKRRAYQRKVAVADFDAVCSGDIYVLESADPKRLLPELLPFLCQSDGFFAHAVGTSAGSLSPRTNWGDLSEYEFALPMLESQLRCVKALTAVRRVEDTLAELIQRQRALQAAFAIDAFSEREMRRYPLVQLSSLCSRVSVGIASSVAHAYRETGVPIIRNTNILPGRVSTDDLLYVDPDFDEEYASKRVHAGDLVITRTATDVPGVAAVVPRDLDGCQTFTTLVCTPEQRQIDPNFLCEWINGPHGRAFVRSYKVGGLQQNLNASLLGQLPLRVPPLQRQREIVTSMCEFGSAVCVTLNRKAELHAVRSRLLGSRPTDCVSPRLGRLGYIAAGWSPRAIRRKTLAASRC